MPSRESKVYNFRLDVEDEALMKAVAQREGYPPSTFARLCVMRRVRRLALQHATQDALTGDSVLERATQK